MMSELDADERERLMSAWPIPDVLERLADGCRDLARVYVAALRAAPASKIDVDFVMRVLNIFAFDGPDPLNWRTDGEYAPVSFFVQHNDFFVWASGDSTVLTPENIDVLEQAIKDVDAVLKEAHPDRSYQYPLDYACKLFACRVNKMRPQGAYYTYIDKALWPLFNDAGPEREIGFGNPHAPGTYQPEKLVG